MPNKPIPHTHEWKRVKELIPSDNPKYIPGAVAYFTKLVCTIEGCGEERIVDYKVEE